MATFVIESVRLSLNELPTLVLLAAIERSPVYCQAEVFVIPPKVGSLDAAFGQLVAIGDGPVDEALAIAVARGVAREELLKMLQAVPETEALASIEFEPEVDTLQIRAARCRGGYTLLSGVASRSTIAYDEIRAFVQTVRGARVELTHL